MRFPGITARQVTVGLLVATGFAVTVVLVGQCNNGASRESASPNGAQSSAAVKHAAAQMLGGPKVQRDPTAQRAGPPDPVAQEISAASAKKAAEVAADLAASTSTDK